MGVCIEERPVMHWQQSARFLGPGAVDKSLAPTQSNQCSSNNCESSAIANKNLLPLRSCASCPNSFGFNKKLTICEAPESYKAASILSPPAKCIISKCHTVCLEAHSENAVGKSLKKEPDNPPSSPESSTETNIPQCTEYCAGCGKMIQDRFFLSAVERRWHVSCLQCHACHQPLDGESTCFSRDGNIFCKSDYYSFFGTKRCSRCLASISSTELVMRAKSLVFHVNCFSCMVCHTPLTKGDQYGIIDTLIYCRTHYSIVRNGENSTLRDDNASFLYSNRFRSSQKDFTAQLEANDRVSTGVFLPAGLVISGLPQAPRQKGRPRKRKSKDIDGLTSNMDLNSEYLDFGHTSHLSSSPRTKRMRTSFKHHQLRTMKSYFAINHNPDAKDLKQLSQKTGLPKRVLQVWFQNARAKWRRMMVKQDGTCMIEKGDGSFDLDNISANSPSSFMIGSSRNSPQLSSD